jgi:SAM-dependent methyltransferase
LNVYCTLEEGDIVTTCEGKSLAEFCRACGYGTRPRSTGRTCNGYQLVCCSRCNALLVEQEPDAAELSRLYNDLYALDEYHAYNRQFDRLVAGRKLPDFHRSNFLRRAEHLTSGRDLVEIGGGVGAFGYRARSRGWNVKIYDVSREALGFARRLGLETYEVDASEPVALAPGSADLVAMWEVLEHLWDLHDYLSGCYEALRPGGVFLASTPNLENPSYKQLETLSSPASTPPVHLNFFIAASLRKVLNSAGFPGSRVVKPRIHRPTSLRPRHIATSFKRLAGLEEPPTLFVIAQKPC